MRVEAVNIGMQEHRHEHLESFLISWCAPAAAACFVFLYQHIMLGRAAALIPWQVSLVVYREMGERAHASTVTAVAIRQEVNNNNNNLPPPKKKGETAISPVKCAHMAWNPWINPPPPSQFYILRSCSIQSDGEKKKGRWRSLYMKENNKPSRGGNDFWRMSR